MIVSELCDLLGDIPEYTESTGDLSNHTVIAEGYEPLMHGQDRHTIRIYITDDQLMVKEYSCNGEVTFAEMTSVFDPTYFRGVKRFYRNKTHPRLVELFEAFGNPLPLI